MINLEKIKIELQNAIKNSPKTQVEIAKKIGVKQQTVAQYLSGIAMPALDTFANLCAVLDLDANEILCVADYKHN